MYEFHEAVVHGACLVVDILFITWTIEKFLKIQKQKIYKTFPSNTSQYLFLPDCYQSLWVAYACFMQEHFLQDPLPVLATERWMHAAVPSTSQGKFVVMVLILTFSPIHSSNKLQTPLTGVPEHLFHVWPGQIWVCTEIAHSTGVIKCTTFLHDFLQQLIADV